MGYSSVGGYTAWGRTHLKVALKHYFIKVRLLQLSDLGYWFVGEQQGTEQVEDKEVIFFFFFNKNQILPASEFSLFGKAYSKHWHSDELPWEPIGHEVSLWREFSALQKMPLQQDSNSTIYKVDN